jgi:hypothetical protein
MPDLLPGLRREYGTRAPSYREEETGVRVGVTLRFLLLLGGGDGFRFFSLIRGDLLRGRDDLNRPIPKIVPMSDPLL